MVRCFEIVGLLSVSPQLKPSLIAVSSQLDIVSESCRLFNSLFSQDSHHVMECHDNDFANNDGHIDESF